MNKKSPLLEQEPCAVAPGAAPKVQQAKGVAPKPPPMTFEAKEGGHHLALSSN